MFTVGSTAHGHALPHRIACDSSGAPRPVATRGTCAGPPFLILLLLAGGALWAYSHWFTGLAPVLPRDVDNLDEAVVEAVMAQVEVVRNAKGDARAHGKLGLIYEGNDLWDEARQCFANAWTLDPSFPLWRYHEAIAVRQAGDIDEALRLLEESARALPKEPGPQQRLGVALVDAGRLEEAQAAFERTVRLVPNMAEGYVGLGDVALSREDYETAVRHLEKAVQLDAGYRTPHYTLGLAYRGLGRLEEAEREIARGIGSTRRFINDELSVEAAGYGVGFMSEFQEARRALVAGQAQKAIQMLERILERYPDDTNVLNNLGSAYRAVGNYERMEELLRRAVAVDEAQFPPHINLGLCYLDTKKLDKAREHADRAVELAPQIAQAQSVRGRVLQAQGEDEEAYETLKKALELDAGLIEVHRSLAQTAARLGRFDEALEHYRDTIRREPDDLTLRIDLVGVLMALEKFDEARAALDDVERMAPDHPSIGPLGQRLELLRQ